MFVLREFCRGLEVESEPNSAVKQPYEAYVMVYILAVSFCEKTS